MNRRNSFKETFMKNKKAYISVFTCLFVVYALLIIGISDTEKKPNDLINENSVAEKEDKTEKPVATVTPVPTRLPEITVAPTMGTENSEAAGSGDVTVIDPEINAPVVEKPKFSPEDGLMMPVEGNIIMPYSMEHGVYHETLCQFMTSDGVLIDAMKGEAALSCTKAEVTDIYTDTRRGKCVELTAGDYKFVYGQLESVSVSVGDILPEGVAVGMIGEPTKYYSEEGEHLYFKVCCGDDTVNPEQLFRKENE